MKYETGLTYIRVDRPIKHRGRYMTKRRIYEKRQVQHLCIASFFIGFLLTLVILGKNSSTAVVHAEGVRTNGETLVGQATAVELPQKLTLRIEIKNYICKKFGKDCERALKIAECESSFNPEAIGVNKNGTVDRGVFQLNTVHNKITSSCAFDARCNIDTAYELFKKQGWRPWVCAKKI